MSLLAIVVLANAVLVPQSTSIDPLVDKAIRGDERARAEIMSWNDSRLSKLDVLFETSDLDRVFALQEIVRAKAAYFAQPDVYRRISRGPSKGLYNMTVWSWVFAAFRSPTAAQSLLSILRTPDNHDQFTLAIWILPEYYNFRENIESPPKSLYSDEDKAEIVKILVRELTVDDEKRSKYAATTILRNADAAVLRYLDVDSLQRRSASIIVGTIGQMPCQSSRRMLASVAANSSYSRSVRQKARTYLAKQTVPRGSGR